MKAQGDEASLCFLELMADLADKDAKLGTARRPAGYGASGGGSWRQRRPGGGASAQKRRAKAADSAGVDFFLEEKEGGGEVPLKASEPRSLNLLSI